MSPNSQAQPISHWTTECQTKGDFMVSKLEISHKADCAAVIFSLMYLVKTSRMLVKRWHGTTLTNKLVQNQKRLNKIGENE